MKINPRPPQPIQPSQAGETARGAETRKAFELSPGATGGKALDALRSRYSAADLDQPAKAEQAVQEAFAALVQDQPVSASLPEDGRGRLSELMAQDPILQRKMLSYLRKALV